MRYLIIALIFCFGRMVAQDSLLQAGFRRFCTDATLKSASIGLAVNFTDSGERILEYNPDLSLSSASTMKVVTTATALEVLGPEYNYVTKLLATGVPDSLGILNGNVMIKGNGDPTIGSRHFNYSLEVIDELISILRNKGVKKIRGNVFFDDQNFCKSVIPDGWVWGDIGNYYGAGVGGLEVFDNSFEVTFKSGVAGTLCEIISVKPEGILGNLKNEVFAANIKSDQAYIFGGPGDVNRVIRGSIPEGRLQFVVKGSLPLPEAAFKQVFLSKLKNSGIEVGGFEMPSASWLEWGGAKSVSLNQIVNATNLKSINHFAENLLITLGYRFQPGCEYSCAADWVKAYWATKGMDVSGFYMNDGSGLSRSNAISAGHLNYLLSYMDTKAKYGQAFYNSLPVSGISGTLTSLGSSSRLKGKFVAKSGTMTRIKSYSGYITCKSGRKLAISIIVNNYTCSNLEITRKIEDLLLVILDYSDKH